MRHFNLNSKNEIQEVDFSPPPFYNVIQLFLFPHALHIILRLKLFSMLPDIILKPISDHHAQLLKETPLHSGKHSTMIFIELVSELLFPSTRW